MDAKDDLLKGDFKNRASRGWLPSAKRRRLYDLRGGFVTEHSPPGMDTPAQWRQQARGTLKYRGSPPPFRCLAGLQREKRIIPTASARCARSEKQPAQPVFRPPRRPSAKHLSAWGSSCFH